MCFIRLFSLSLILIGLIIMFICFFITRKNDNKPVKKETKKAKKQAPKAPKKSYSSEVKAELKKVNWPSKKDLTKYGIATIIFIVIFGLYFYGLDALFAWLSSLVKGL